MAYDEDLADRIRGVVVSGTTGHDERRMFGGLAFLVGGHMAVGASGQGGIMVRVPPEQTQALIDGTDANPMIMRGSQSRGWVRVATEHLADDDRLAHWVGIGVSFASSLPPKS